MRKTNHIFPAYRNLKCLSLTNNMLVPQIYNECVRDLLCPDSGSLELREDSSGSITVSNLLDISASSTDVVLGMLRMGNTNRTSEPTVANRTSSRSHAILKVFFKSIIKFNGQGWSGFGPTTFIGKACPSFFCLPHNSYTSLFLDTYPALWPNHHKSACRGPVIVLAW